jgi:hypothetical protein
LLLLLLRLPRWGTGGEEKEEQREAMGNVGFFCGIYCYYCAAVGMLL